MKTRLILAFAAGLLLMPIVGYAETVKDAKDVPPVASTLVREGDFSVKLVETLNIAKADNEAQAEKTLANLGIAPKNGWISDYPVTPAVLGDIRDLVAKAADAGKIDMNRYEALKGLDDLEESLGLQIAVAKEGETEARVTTSDYENPESVTDYYGEEGPPVMSYYAPPDDYNYLYDYVPYPFFYTSFYFPGFFILRHFSTAVVVVNARAVIVNANVAIINGMHRVVSNVVINPVTRAALVVNPVSRQLVTVTARTAVWPNNRFTTVNGSNWTATNRAAAQSIMSRGAIRHAPATATVNMGNARTFSAPNMGNARTFSAPAPMVRSGPVRTFNAPAPVMRGGGFFGHHGGGCMGRRC
jgi:hypothetical protein